MPHISVLLQETIEGLKVRSGETFLDGTFNNGGHSIEVCQRLGNSVRIIGIDLDSDALAKARERFAKEPCHIALHEENFRNLDKVLKKEGLSQVDCILLDLGFSSVQIEGSGRGFSFLRDEPLLMTYSKANQKLTAKDIVNFWDEEHLETIIRHYGEERRAKRIAEAIVAARKEGEIETSGQLAEIISQALGGKKGRLHPATKTFQAIRITVNDEIEALREALEKGFSHLSVGGRFAVISFHSLEDRIVKRFFREKAKASLGTLLAKKPIVASEEELKRNPRARSAKLRIIKKTKHEND